MNSKTILGIILLILCVPLACIMYLVLVDYAGVVPNGEGGNPALVASIIFAVILGTLGIYIMESKREF